MLGGFYQPGSSGWEATPSPTARLLGEAVAAQGDRNKRKDGLRLRLAVVMMQKLEIRDKMR